jgi:hypothetical protein
MGLIQLVRVGGKTLLTNETLQDIVAGKIKIDDHPARKHRPEPQSRRGRPRKSKG